MRYFFSFHFLYLLLSLALFSCIKEENIPISVTTAGIDKDYEVQDFIWRGLNGVYLWKDKVSLLADSQRSNIDSYNKLLSQEDTPEKLFYSLLYRYKETDRFSFINDDYLELEKQLSGVNKSSGMIYNIKQIEADSDLVIGYVEYVLPDSDAYNKGIRRGDLFTKINGFALTRFNFRDLLFSTNSYTVGFVERLSTGDLKDKNSVMIVETEMSENPIQLTKVLDRPNGKVGYLMYNGFYKNYDNELNLAFGQFKSKGITDLVLDLRYNGGGSIRTARYLASMITGQFDNQVLYQEIWNDKYQSFFKSNNPKFLLGYFDNELSDKTPINSLNLQRVYVLTSRNTASASELIISTLRPYIDVIQIGDVTFGKYTASITLYDSPNFTREDATSNHRYAIQPIVFKYANKDGFTDFNSGLIPVLSQEENIYNLGVLGQENEPLLALALKNIDGITAGDLYDDTILGEEYHENLIPPRAILQAELDNLSLL